MNELGVFRMTGKGMQVVPNPSEELLSHRAKGASGSTVFCGMSDTVQIRFDEPVRAPASGQYAVFYDESSRILGSGVIE